MKFRNFVLPLMIVLSLALNAAFGLFVQPAQAQSEGEPTVQQEGEPTQTPQDEPTPAPTETLPAIDAGESPQEASLFAYLPAVLRQKLPMPSGKIVFATKRDLGWEIYRMNADGTNQVNLTNTKKSIDDYDPCWSADGKKIAFYSNRDFNTDGSWNYEIYVMNADGTGQKNLSNNKAVDAYPSWSPDGKKVAFTSDRTSGNWDIWVMNADGTSPTRLTTHAAKDFKPVWSPDGKKIAFLSEREHGVPEVFVMNADGTSQKQLTDDRVEKDHPEWSPDSAQLAYVSYISGSNGEIYIMTASGANQTNLTNDAANDHSPAWSPDGKLIMFVSNRGGAWKMYAMNTVGAGLRSIEGTEGQEMDWIP